MVYSVFWIYKACRLWLLTTTVFSHDAILSLDTSQGVKSQVKARQKTSALVDRATPLPLSRWRQRVLFSTSVHVHHTSDHPHYDSFFSSPIMRGFHHSYEISRRFWWKLNWQNKQKESASLIKRLSIQVFVLVLIVFGLTLFWFHKLYTFL